MKTTTIAKPISRAIAPLVLAAIAHVQPQARQCTPVGSTVPLPGLTEASGLAASRRVPGRLWTHNDSGQPLLFALDGRGGVAGQVQVTGAMVEDWEGLAVGACGSGSCLYIGDIGDNEASRARITIYRVPEPEHTGGAVQVFDVLHATYPDGPRDAEALFVVDGRLYIVTKSERAFYRFPPQLEAGATMRLERVGGAATEPEPDARVTDGATSPDGQWVVLRSRSALTFHRASDVLAGQSRAAATVDLTALDEPQGEGVAFGTDDTVFLVGEAGGKGAAGTFARLSCSGEAPKG